MLPQNVPQGRPHQQQQPGMPAFMTPSSPQNQGFDQHATLDPSSIAKQMAALNAAGMARMANGRPIPGTGATPYLNQHSGQESVNQNLQQVANANMQANTQPPDTSVMAQAYPAARASQQNAQSVKQRQRNFLSGLANMMNNRDMPLPQALTGIPSNYDPTNSPWKIIEPTPGEVGSFRLAGRDVDMFKLWGIVFHLGGGQKLTAENKWGLILPYFDLPEQFPVPQPNGNASVAGTLAQYYMYMLHPFEDAYKRNMEQQRRAGKQPGTVPQSQIPGGPVGQQHSPQTGATGTPLHGVPVQMGPTQPGNLMGMVNAQAPAAIANSTPQFSPPSQPSSQSPQRPTSAQHPGSRTPQSTNAQPSSDFLSGNQPLDKLESEVQGMKRKLDSEETDAKRARQKTDPAERASAPPGSDRDSQPPTAISNAPSTSTSTPLPPQPPRQQPSRRKIEYVPLAREVDTYGGRDLRIIEEEMTRLTQRRPIRDINDWGNVDIEHLIMSIRSRLSTELSYALTTFTLLSTMRAQTQGSGFPISQCVELLEEVVDLLEDEAFGDEDSYEADLADDPPIITHREMVNRVQDDANELFVGLKHRQGSKDPARGPRQREGHMVLAVLNIIRNLSTFPDNWPCLAQQEGMLDLMLRVCSVERSKDGAPRAASTVLSLTDLITARKDVLYTLTNIAGLIQFTSDPSVSKVSARMVRRIFELVSSFLVDPMEAVPPLTVAQQLGIPLHGGNVKAPTLPDIALEVFTRLSQQDLNRQVFSRCVPQAWLLGLFKSLVHRLPVIDPDFQLAARDTWLAYLEKTVLAIYSLAFLLPPAVKAEIKADRSLAFTKVMLRMIQKFLMNPVQEGKSWFMVCTRRAIETLKLVDDAADSFDVSKSTAPTLSFGMGFSEVGDGETETGTGLLGGYRMLAWDMLMVREVDSVMFSELESLARIS